MAIGKGRRCRVRRARSVAAWSFVLVTLCAVGAAGAQSAPGAEAPDTTAVPPLVAVVVDTLPQSWSQLRADDNVSSGLAPAELSRDELERAGARTPFQVLALVPGFHTMEVASIIDVGAVAADGSYGGVDLTVDHLPVRLARMEGKDLSAMLLDRLSPHAGYASLASMGRLSLAAARPSQQTGGRPVRFDTRELAPEEGPSRSRVAVHTAGYGFTGGGLTLFDQREWFSYRVGVMNGTAGRSGAIDHVSTRLAAIDLDWKVAGWRFSGRSRNAEHDRFWKFGQALKLDAQATTLIATRGDSLYPAWRLHVGFADDRLNGDAHNAEFKRRGWDGGVRFTPAWQPVWAAVAVSRDQVILRGVTQRFEPVVERANGRVGGMLGAGPLRLRLEGRARVSDRHAPKLAGEARLQVSLDEHWQLFAAAERRYGRPTLDQEVLAIGNTPADPERHDVFEVGVQASAPATLTVSLARRHLADVPFIDVTSDADPWPTFRFRGRQAAHWHSHAAVLSPPLGRFAVRLGGSIDHYALDDDPRWAPAFVPELNARGTASAELVFFGGDLVLRPRVDAVVVGERYDFAGGRLGEYLRLDMNLVAIMLGGADLELGARNLTSEFYPLAVIDPQTGLPYTDTGRNLTAGIRWRFLD